MDKQYENVNINTSIQYHIKPVLSLIENLIETLLFPGEQIISHAESVLKYAPYSDRKQGMSGNLFVTNFKVCFVTADKSSYTYKEVSQGNLLLFYNWLFFSLVLNICCVLM